ncbi:hypothetical protein ACH5RR_025710 [Cinchona calisaya]|uniref:Uncharacterized protein n=1 Tax=Cinchona calisaya TaxID=153742 RepID=A0ABD2Z1I9_9GENT
MRTLGFMVPFSGSKFGIFLIHWINKEVGKAIGGVLKNVNQLERSSDNNGYRELTNGKEYNKPIQKHIKQHQAKQNLNKGDSKGEPQQGTNSDCNILSDDVEKAGETGMATMEENSGMDIELAVVKGMSTNLGKGSTREEREEFYPDQKGYL